MSIELKLERTDNGVRVSLPPEMVDRLGGEPLYAVETDHGILLTARDPDMATIQLIYQDVEKRYHQTLRDLAH